ncbi:MAG: stage 0 sporulation family protein [Victivallaceae bacterium]|nr:regulatory iron-sulfur-containing complex subunit RicT [Victivallaceae bacterium]
MDLYYTMRLDNGATVPATGSDEIGLKKFDLCVIRRDFYCDVAQVAIIHGDKEPDHKSRDVATVQRAATDQDRETAKANLEKARGSFRTALNQVELLKLPMKLLNCHHSLDNKLVTIQFTADGRVDFRELVKDLSRIMGCRIELRQIGVRDEAAICGGIGICGQELCCRRFLKEFNSINVRMAKDQDLSLTPGTISGACGRLKCCLKFEHAGYVELERSMPRRGDICDSPQGKGRVVDRNLLTGRVSLQLDSNGNIVICERKEVTVISSGRKGGNRSEPVPQELKDME